MFSIPEQYGGRREGKRITEEMLLELSSLSGIFLEIKSEMFNFMNDEFRQKCEHYLPDPQDISSIDAIDVYRF